MNIDLTKTIQEASSNLSIWRDRYSSHELPYKIVLNIFYRKFTIECMFDKALNLSSDSWDDGYQQIMKLYGQVAGSEVVHNLEKWVAQDVRVGAQRFSDFAPYIENARSGSLEGIAPIQYTYLLHRVIDELVLAWIAYTTSGLSQIDSISQLTNIIIETGHIDSYEQIEAIMDQLGAESELRKYMR